MLALDANLAVCMNFRGITVASALQLYPSPSLEAVRVADVPRDSIDDVIKKRNEKALKTRGYEE